MEQQRGVPTPKELKDQRHTENLKIFTGRHRGVYYDNGMANPGKFIAEMRLRSRFIASVSGRS